jgi:hypothetical protein
MTSRNSYFIVYPSSIASVNRAIEAASGPAVIAELDPAIHRKKSASFEADGYAGQARV